MAVVYINKDLTIKFTIEFIIAVIKNKNKNSGNRMKNNEMVSEKLASI